MSGYGYAMAPAVRRAVLEVEAQAGRVNEVGLLAYWTEDPYHLRAVEREVAVLELRMAGLRLALQAVRSRGEMPTAAIGRSAGGPF